MLGQYHQGDVLKVQFPEITYGSEQKGIRPALVISNDMGNYYSDILSVAPITSQRKTNLPTHVSINKGVGGLKVNSTCLLEQTTCISTERVLDKLGHINTNSVVYKRVKKALKVVYHL